MAYESFDDGERTVTYVRTVRELIEALSALPEEEKDNIVFLDNGGVSFAIGAVEFDKKYKMVTLV